MGKCFLFPDFWTTFVSKETADWHRSHLYFRKGADPKAKQSKLFSTRQPTDVVAGAILHVAVYKDSYIRTPYTAVIKYCDHTAD